MNARASRSGSRVAVITVVLVLIGGAVYLNETAPSRAGPQVAAAAATTAAVVQGPVVPGADALSSAWYCAEGTSSADGRADETVIVSNLSASPIDATISVMSGSDQPVVTRKLRVDTLGQERVRITDMIATADPGVVVEVFGGPAVVEHELIGHNDVAIGACSRQASRDWYFAAGTTARDATEVLALFNPYGDDAIVDISFLTDSGPQAPEAFQGLVVPRRTRVSVPVSNEVRRQDHVATFVRARTGRVVAERSELFDGSQARVGLAVSLGATAPAARWLLPFGDSDPGSHVVSVANFDILPTEVEVDALVEGNAVVEPQTVGVPGRSVVAVDVGGKVPAGSNYIVIVHVTRRAPVVVESFVTQNATTGSPGSATAIGATGPAKRWAFALGRTDVSSDARIVAYNPGPRPVTVELLAYTEGDANSPSSAPGVAVETGDVGEFDLAEHDIEPGQVLVVQADGPIVVGRQLVMGGVSMALGIPFAP